MSYKLLSPMDKEYLKKISQEVMEQKSSPSEFKKEVRKRLETSNETANWNFPKIYQALQFLELV